MPQSFLKPKDNLLVLLEEESGNPFGISLDTISRTKVCGLVSDSNLPPANSWMRDNSSGIIYQKKPHRRPVLRLQCPTNSTISNILFTSFGTPLGDCENHAIGSCHSSNSRTIIEKVSFCFCNLFLSQYAFLFFLC